MRTTDSLEKTLMLGKTEGRRRRGQQNMRCLDGITDSMDLSFEQAPGVGEGQWGLACCGPWSHKESDITEQLDWTELTSCIAGRFNHLNHQGSQISGAYGRFKSRLCIHCPEVPQMIRGHPCVRDGSAAHLSLFLALCQLPAPIWENSVMMLPAVREASPHQMREGCKDRCGDGRTGLD